MNEAYCRRRFPGEPETIVRRSFALPTAKPKYAPDRPARVEHIALTLSFDFHHKILHGKCATTFTAIAGSITEVEMDAAALTIIKAATPSGKRLAWDHIGSKLRITLAKPLAAERSTTVVIDYEARQPRQGIYFIGPDEGYPNKPVQVWTQGQDEDAHYWFPCIDYPNAKATTELTAIVPSDFFVLSNGALVKTTTDARKRTKTYHWKMDVPHVTYLVTCVAGKFAGHTDTVERIPVSYYVQPGREADGERSFGKTPKMLRFFGDRLDCKYPYAKYAQIAVSDFIFGGMENTTATTQTDTTLHDARAHLDFSSDGLVAHELAHQWFGDWLTCKDWSHAWLNEGFATYFEALFKEFDRGEEEFDYYRIELQDAYKREDHDRYRRPIVTNVFVEPVDLFDRHLYEKAACVLHMVRRQLGETSWWKAMRRYVAVNAMKNVETVDLARAIEDATGQNFAPFFDQWVMRPGHPEFDVTFAWEASAHRAVLNVAQTQNTSDQTPLFKVPIAIDFQLSDGTRETYTVMCEGASQQFSFPLRAKPEAFSFDGGGDVIRSLTLHVPREMLEHTLRKHPKVTARVDAARALGVDASPQAVDALSAALRSDKFWGVAVEAARALGKIRGEHAFAALASAGTAKHPKVRRAVAEALGEFRTDAACRALAKLLKKDASYLVEATAAAAIGKTRAKAAFALLRAAAKRNSWNDVVRSGALAGFAELGDERAVPILIGWTKYGKSPFARRAALAALGKIGEGRKDVRDVVIGLLDDRSFFVRMAAVGALETLHDRAALPALEAIALADVDGRLKRRSAEAVRTIREHALGSAEMRQLRDELVELRSANRLLADRLELLERNGKRPASKR